MGREIEAIDEISADKIAAPIEEVSPQPTLIDADLVSVEQPVAPSYFEAPATQETVPKLSLESARHGFYRVTDLSRFQANPDQFFEFGYRDTLKRMIDAVIETESPLRTDILAQRLARAHGWLRTGVRIRERIDLHLRLLDRTSESSGEFIWEKGTVSKIVPYRQPANEEARRSIADIPLAEVTHVVLGNPELLEEPDPTRDLARLLGVERLTTVSRARLDEAIARAKQHTATPLSSG
jgi:Protein of unknown function (DUF3320)